MKHYTTALNQPICVDVSLGRCDHPSMREVGDGIWPRKKLATLAYSYLLTLAS